jgi:hypothetical protein
MSAVYIGNEPRVEAELIHDKPAEREGTSSPRGFIATPRQIWRATNLSPNAKLAYIGLLDYAWDKDDCWPGQAVLCETIGFSEPTLRNALRELAEARLIRKQRRGRGLTSKYILLPTEEGHLEYGNSNEHGSKIHQTKAVEKAQDRKILTFKNERFLPSRTKDSFGKVEPVEVEAMKKNHSSTTANRELEEATSLEPYRKKEEEVFSILKISPSNEPERALVRARMEEHPDRNHKLEARRCHDYYARHPEKLTTLSSAFAVWEPAPKTAKAPAGTTVSQQTQSPIDEIDDIPLDSKTGKPYPPGDICQRDKAWTERVNPYTLKPLTDLEISAKQPCVPGCWSAYRSWQQACTDAEMLRSKNFMFLIDNLPGSEGRQLAKAVLFNSRQGRPELVATRFREERCQDADNLPPYDDFNQFIKDAKTDPELEKRWIEPYPIDEKGQPT